MKRENEIGLALRKIRRDRDLTQEELANMLGCTKQVISRYERGDRKPKWETIIEYARILKIDVKELISSQISYDDITDKDFINTNPSLITETSVNTSESLISVIKDCGIGVIGNGDKIFITNACGGIEISKQDFAELLDDTNEYIKFTFNKYINKKLKDGLKTME